MTFGLEALVQIFGGAGVAVFIMWLWLKDVKKERDFLRVQNGKLNEKRIEELTKTLPLINDAIEALEKSN